MPLKAIYGKSPLVEAYSLSLCPGQIRRTDDRLQQLADRLNTMLTDPAVWLAAFRLNSQLTDQPLETEAAKAILACMEQQDEEGALACSAEAITDVIAAAWAVYTCAPNRALLEKLMKWCAWADRNWDTLIGTAALRRSPADLMAVLTGLYKVTGKKGLLKLCDQLRRDAMDWSGLLNTFSVSKPLHRIISAADLKAGMAQEAAAESWSETGFYTRQYLSCHAEALADGVRSCQNAAVYSGSRQELSAARSGWEKISRYHGAVCGGVHAQGTMMGRDPSAPLETGAIGAWTEALAAELPTKGSEWAAEALDQLLHNAIPAVFADGLCAAQQVNSLPRTAAKAADAHQLTRLARGLAAAGETAVSAAPDGVQIHLYLNGTYTLRLKDTQARLDVAAEENMIRIALKTAAPIKCALHLRIPAWMEQVSLNGSPVDPAVHSLVVDREWKTGDVLTLTFEKKLRTLACYHQGIAVQWGADLMTIAGQKTWALAADGEPFLKDGQVWLNTAGTDTWQGTLPVLPSAVGPEQAVTLVPYASSSLRLTMLPQRKAE